MGSMMPDVHDIPAYQLMNITTAARIVQMVNRFLPDTRGKKFLMHPTSGEVTVEGDAEFVYQLECSRYGLLPWERDWVVIRRVTCLHGHRFASNSIFYGRRLQGRKTRDELRTATESWCFVCHPQVHGEVLAMISGDALELTARIAAETTVRVEKDRPDGSDPTA